jgi:hypothetical protein
VVYGDVDCNTGTLASTVLNNKLATDCLAILLDSVANYADQKILLVCEDGRFHATNSARLRLVEQPDGLHVPWLVEEFSILRCV